MVNENSMAPAMAPVTGAADRFEVMAGDLISRVDVARRKDRSFADGLEAFGIITAAKRLENAVAEHKHELAAPLGEKSAFLIERQGERIRGLEKRVEELESLALVAAEFARWRERHEHATLKAEAAIELNGALRKRLDDEKAAHKSVIDWFQREQAEHAKAKAELEKVRAELAAKIQPE